MRVKMYTERDVLRIEVDLASEDNGVVNRARFQLHDARQALFRNLGWRNVHIGSVVSVRREYSALIQDLKAAQKTDRNVAKFLKPEVRNALVIQRGAQWVHDYLSGDNTGSTDNMGPWEVYGVRCALNLAEHRGGTA